MVECTCRQGIKRRDMIQLTGKNMQDPLGKITKAKRARVMVQVIEWHEALNSTPISALKIKAKYAT
jgi:hypothetical protein